ncbi:MAG: group 1 truncated hemoglobin [Alphaproteobacteria bacterium]|nr:group 1 truncated hemoglobin [Alphaproteobacteria bacterium]
MGTPRSFLAVLGAAVISLGVAACADTGMKKKEMADQSLYDRLGGVDAITVVVDDFVARMAADDTVNFTFAKAGTDIGELKRLLVEQICQATGGPCTYTGRDMRTTHAGMGVTETQFNTTGGHLAAALDAAGVGAREKDELLNAIGSMKDQIVGL